MITKKQFLKNEKKNKLNKNMQNKLNSLTVKSQLSSAQVQVGSSKSISNNSTLASLHPWYITGFGDAEGSFMILTQKNRELLNGYRVSLVFAIALHKKDLPFLELFKENFNNVGNITKQGKDAVQYRVSSPKDLRVIIDHFDKYPLITQKRADYELFKQAFELVNRKEHITKEGFKKILEIKASLNNGLSDCLKAAFPYISPVPRPLVQLPSSFDPFWVVGFVEGDGCFYISITNSSLYKSGAQVKLRFLITQHSRDEQLMKSLAEYLGCGVYYLDSGGDHGEFIVTRFSDITDKIIPFFDKYPLQGAKSLDFADFRKASGIVKVKAHLADLGLEQIRLIKTGMNRGRNNS